MWGGKCGGERHSITPQSIHPIDPTPSWAPESVCLRLGNPKMFLYRDRGKVWAEPDWWEPSLYRTNNASEGSGTENQLHCKWVWASKIEAHLGFIWSVHCLVCGQRPFCSTDLLTGLRLLVTGFCATQTNIGRSGFFAKFALFFCGSAFLSWLFSMMHFTLVA